MAHRSVPWSLAALVVVNGSGWFFQGTEDAGWNSGLYPGSPTGVAASAGDSNAFVTWTAPSNSGSSPITSYIVTASDGCAVQGAMTVFGSPPPTNVLFTGLNNGVAHTFTVTAVNSYGSGPPSLTSNFVTPSGTVPSWVSACSSQQYVLAHSDGVTWMPIDASRLAVSLTTGAAAAWAVMTANVDLWTLNAGYNQDVGISVDGTLVGWKESGGFAGTFSPNAATLQVVIPLAASTIYTAMLQWKTNRPDPGSIYAGAGPIAGAYSPTRLTVQLIPTASARVFSVSSTQQYRLAGSDGATWKQVDGTNLSLSFAPPTGRWDALITGNADLWTADAGYNQDLGIEFGSGLDTWKESGGFAGTYSPNAAFVEDRQDVLSGTTYTVTLLWKANRFDSGSIYAGAGPVGARFSPTTLTVVLVPSVPGVAVGGTTLQYRLDNSDGSTWQVMDAVQLQLSFNGAGSYQIGALADLWTSVATYNQDLGIMVSGGAYGAGTLVAWKESGGFAGTFSPNAVFVTTDLHLDSGVTYTVWVVWKTNRRPDTSSVIWAGAGPVATHFSPSWVTALQLS